MPLRDPHHHPDNTFTVRAFCGPAGLEQIRAEWADLAGRMAKCAFFHTIAWYRCYLDALARDPAHSCCIVVYKDGRAEAILPFVTVVRRCLGLRVVGLELPSHPHLPFADIVAVADGDALLGALPRLLAEQTAVRWDYIGLPKILDGSAALVAFDGQRELRTFKAVAGASCYLAVQPYATMAKGFSKNWRETLRKARNRLARIDAHYVDVAGPDRIEQAYRSFLDAEASGWKGAQGTATAIKLDPSLARFYAMLANECAAACGTRIPMLAHGSTTIAAAFCVADADTVYLLKIGINEQYARLSPGRLLIEHIIKDCDERTGHRYVSLVSDAPWLAQLRPASRTLWQVYVFAAGWRGWQAALLVLVPLVVRREVHRLAQKLFVKVRGKLRWRRFGAATRG